jgi:hypothetical protein
MFIPDTNPDFLPIPDPDSGSACQEVVLSTQNIDAQHLCAAPQCSMVLCSARHWAGSAVHIAVFHALFITGTPPKIAAQLKSSEKKFNLYL